LFEDLREINRRAAHFGGDLGQRPAPRQITRQHELNPIRQPSPSDTGARRVRSSRPQGPLRQSQGQAFRFQRFRDLLPQAVPQQRHERLSPRIDPQALLSKRQRRAVAQKSAWRQFAQIRFADDQRQTGIATWYGVADPITFGGVEKQRLVRLGDGLVTTQPPHIDAAIRKHQLCVGRALFRALATGTALAVHIPDRYGRSFQQRLNGKFRHEFSFRCSTRQSDPEVG
jgi:hypothetical protein